MGIDVIDQLQIKFSAFVGYYRKSESIMRRYISYV
jgi:hypothetical protein